MKLSVKILPILLIAAQANADEICSIRASGETEEEAQQKATNSLAMKIKSKVVVSSKSEETIDGRKSNQRDISTQEVYSELRNQHTVKYKDEFFSTACISSEDAAKPYLDDSRVLASKLKNAFLDLRDVSEKSLKKEYWEKVNAIYKELKDLEVIIISLNQTNTNLQKEYNDYYKEAKNEYESFLLRLDKGIYVESSNSYLKNRIRTLLSSDCILAEKEMAALNLKLNVEEDQKLAGELAYCYIDIAIELKGSKIKPYTYHTTKPEKEGGIDMERACKDATDKAVGEIWNPLKREIIKGGCK
jgi:hypothetical protein